MHTNTVSMLVVIGVMTALVGFVRAGAPPLTRAESAASLSVPLELNQPINLDLKSDDVKWGGNTFQLLRIVKAEFHLDDTDRLSATLNGSSTTFDDVEYTVHAAVFDKNGRACWVRRQPHTMSHVSGLADC